MYPRKKYKNKSSDYFWCKALRTLCINKLIIPKRLNNALIIATFDANLQLVITPAAVGAHQFLMIN